jgi:hypothetical protein
MTKRVDRHRPRLHLDRLALAREVIGALPVDLDRRIGGGHLFDRPGKSRQHRLDFGEGRPHIAGRNHLALGIESRGLNPERDREVIDFACVEHPAAKLSRLAERDREDSRRERVERAAMADLDLAQPRLAADTFHRAYRLRRAEPHGFVEDDPAVHPAPLEHFQVG